MNEDRDENRAFYEKLTESNPIRTEMYRFQRRLKRLIDGQDRSQMLVGPPGCGKDTAVYAALDAAGAQYRNIVDVSVKGLKHEFHSCARDGVIAVINDNDAPLWRNDAMIELLMRATGEDSGRKRHDLEYEMPQSFLIFWDYDYSSFRIAVRLTRV